MDASKLKPGYYKSGDFDVIAFCIHHELDFLQGNVIKYVTRYKQKNGIEDLQKAKIYLERIIDNLQKNA